MLTATNYFHWLHAWTHIYARSLLFYILVFWRKSRYAKYLDHWLTSNGRIFMERNFCGSDFSLNRENSFQYFGFFEVHSKWDGFYHGGHNSVRILYILTILNTTSDAKVDILSLGSTHLCQRFWVELSLAVNSLVLVGVCLDFNVFFSLLILVVLNSGFCCLFRFDCFMSDS